MNWFRTKRSERDVELFRFFEGLMGEEEVRFFLILLLEEKAFYSSGRTRILELLQFFEKEENRFQDRRLQEALAKFLQTLVELKVLTATHFFVFPLDQTGENLRHCLHPDYFIFEIQDISLEEHRFFLKAEAQLRQTALRAGRKLHAFRALAYRRLGL